ncbi:uncharacterized protein LOC142226845 isoform X1 [Haematobia irritans]|uniref:uncharacterized protein LOC142226845 isoform X1 n=1 Tax=Haematobia irritans TaxID=7368 RepID=UPI003F4F70E3
MAFTTYVSQNPITTINLQVGLEEKQSQKLKILIINFDKNEPTVAVYSATSRGRIQLIYGGQPFIFEKKIKLPNNEEKKYWRCNQWWNQKCRSRVCTINDMVLPLNRYHTHEEIVRRKKRVRKNVSSTGQTPDKTNNKSSVVEATTSASGTLDSTLGMHLKYEEIVADVTDMVEPTSIVMTKK